VHIDLDASFAKVAVAMIVWMIVVIGEQEIVNGALRHIDYHDTCLQLAYGHESPWVILYPRLDGSSVPQGLGFSHE
jgi:hypothetical protein